MLISKKGDWYLLGRPDNGGDLHLWVLDRKAGIKPTREYDLPGTDMLEGYVIHTLEPVRFGGEEDGDTIHVGSARYVNDQGQKPAPGEKPTCAQLWHAQFDLPSARMVTSMRRF